MTLSANAPAEHQSPSAVLTPTLPPACKISGLENESTQLQTLKCIFRSYNTYDQFYAAFWSCENPFTLMPGKSRESKKA